MTVNGSFEFLRVHQNLLARQTSSRKRKDFKLRRLSSCICKSVSAIHVPAREISTASRNLVLMGVIIKASNSPVRVYKGIKICVYVGAPPFEPVPALSQPRLAHAVQIVGDRSRRVRDVLLEPSDGDV